MVPVYIQRTYTAHHRNSLRVDETTSTQNKEREEERNLVSSRQTYNQNKIAGGMHLVSLNNKEASRNDGVYLRINVNQERNAVTS